MYKQTEKLLRLHRDGRRKEVIHLICNSLDRYGIEASLQYFHVLAYRKKQLKALIAWAEQELKNL